MTRYDFTEYDALLLIKQIIIVLKKPPPLVDNYSSNKTLELSSQEGVHISDGI